MKVILPLIHPGLLLPLLLLAWRLLGYPLAKLPGDAMAWMAAWLLYLHFEAAPERRDRATQALLVVLFTLHGLGQIPYTLDMLRSL